MTTFIASSEWAIAGSLLSAKRNKPIGRNKAASLIYTAHLDGLRSYDRVWASSVVKRAWQHLQNALEKEGKVESLEVLRPFVVGGGGTPPNQEEAAAKLGVPIATLRTWLSRLHQRYREALRREVASTVSDPADVDQELRYLYQILIK